MQTNRLSNLLKMLEQQADDAFLLYAIAIEYESMGDDAQAEAYFERIYTVQPDYLPLYYKFGHFKAKQQAWKEALAWLEKGKELARNQKDNKTLREINEAIQMVEEDSE